MQEVDLVAAVIDDDVRMVVEGFIEEVEVFFVGRTVPSIDRKAVFDESGCDVILVDKGLLPVTMTLAPAR